MKTLIGITTGHALLLGALVVFTASQLLVWTAWVVAAFLAAWTWGDYQRTNRGGKGAGGPAAFATCAAHSACAFLARSA
jgi:hypothetical protein